MSKKIVTHNGHFHTDDLLAVATLLIKYPDAEVIRSRDERIIKSADFVVDVGLIHNPDKGRFDHHQKSGAGKRPNDILYASFGLVWRIFGQELAGGRDEAKLIEDKLVTPVDAIDNGIDLSTPLFNGIKEYSVGDFFESFANGAETLEELDQAFKRALPLAIELLKREIEVAARTIEGWRKVKRIYNESEVKKIIVIPGGLSWKRVLIPTEAVFVVYPRTDSLWGAQAVPKALNSFENKKSFPTSWAGLTGKTLAAVSKVKDAVFCHRDRWLANAKSKEGAIKLAEVALNS